MKITPADQTPPDSFAREASPLRTLASVNGELVVQVGEVKLHSSSTYDELLSNVVVGGGLGKGLRTEQWPTQGDEHVTLSPCQLGGTVSGLDRRAQVDVRTRSGSEDDARRAPRGSRRPSGAAAHGEAVRR